MQQPVPAFSQSLSRSISAGWLWPSNRTGQCHKPIVRHLGVPLCARVYMGTGSLTAAVLGMIGFLLITGLFAATMRGRRLNFAVT